MTKEEIKETKQINATWYLGLDPGIEEGISLKQTKQKA